MLIYQGMVFNIHTSAVSAYQSVVKVNQRLYEDTHWKIEVNWYHALKMETMPKQQELQLVTAIYK